MVAFILSIGRTIFGTIFSSTRSIIITIVILLAAGSLWYVHSLRSDIQELTSTNSILTTNNKTLTDNNKTLKDNLTVVSSANNENLKTVDQLKSERADAQRAIDKLNTLSKNDKVALNVLSNRVDELIKNPLNDGALSPVLKETMRGIQDNRKN